MTKITLTDLVNLQNETTAVNAINDNNNIIVAEFDNTLSRDGTTPNQMLSQLDMNSNHIINLPSPVLQSEPIRLQDLTNFTQFQNSVNLAAAVASATASASTATTGATTATTQAAIATAAAAVTSGAYTQRVVPHSRFSYIPGNISVCATPGGAKHDIDLNTAFDFNWGSNGGFLGPENDRGIPAWNHDVLVATTGNDSTGDGTPNKPFATVKVAYAKSGVGTVWIAPGVYKEQWNLLGTDNSVGGVASRSIKIRALYGPGTVQFADYIDQQPWEMTWTTFGSGWQATPTGHNKVQQIIQVTTSPNTGRKTYSILTRQTSAGNVTVNGDGWFQDNSTRLISIAKEHMDFTTQAVSTQFFICYTTSLAQYNAISGCVTYLEGIDFVATATLGIFWQLGQTGRRPVAYIKNCGFYYLEGSGVHPEGCDCYFQNLTILGNSVGDGFNYYPDQVAGTSSICQALEVDCDVSYSGTQSADGPSTRNCQASSAHTGMTVIQINGNYRQSFGQNVAHIGTNTYYWCVGGEFGSPFTIIPGSGTGGTLISMRYDNVYVEGVVWLDTCRAYGIGSDFGLRAQTGSTCKVFNCNFQGFTANTFGVLIPYTPASP